VTITRPANGEAELAALVHELRQRVRKLERSNQISRGSVLDQPLDVYDSDENLAMQVGEQWDGAVIAVPLRGPEPPIPTPPVCTPGLRAVTVHWDGLWEPYYDEDGVSIIDDQVVAPMDFARVEIHASTDPDFTAEFASTLVGTFETPRGGDQIVAIPTTGEDYTIKLVCRNLSGGRSDPSDGTLVQANDVNTTDDLPPSDPPGIEVIGGLGAIFVKVIPVPNRDPVTYEYHASTQAFVNAVPGDATTLVHEGPEASFTIRELPGGVKVGPAPVPIWVQVIAKDEGTNGEWLYGPGSQVKSAMPVQITSADIAANQGWFGYLSSVDFRSGTITGDVVLGGKFLTQGAGPGLGAGWEGGAEGARWYDSEGNVVVEIPSNISADNPATFRGKGTFDQLEAQLGATLRGTSRIMPGAIMELANAQQPPATGPVPVPVVPYIDFRLMDALAYTGEDRELLDVIGVQWRGNPEDEGPGAARLPFPNGHYEVAIRYGWREYHILNGLTDSDMIHVALFDSNGNFVPRSGLPSNVSFEEISLVMDAPFFGGVSWCRPDEFGTHLLVFDADDKGYYKFEGGQQYRQGILPFITTYVETPTALGGSWYLEPDANYGKHYLPGATSPVSAPAEAGRLSCLQYKTDNIKNYSSGTDLYYSVRNDWVHELVWHSVRSTIATESFGTSGSEAGWTTDVNATVSRITPSNGPGTGVALALTNKSGQAKRTVILAGPGPTWLGGGQGFPVTPGRRYRVKWDAWSSESNGATCTATLRFYDADGNPIHSAYSPSWQPGGKSVTATTVTKFDEVVVAPITAVYLRFSLSFTNVNGGARRYIDNVTIELDSGWQCETSYGAQGGDLMQAWPFGTYSTYAPAGVIVRADTTLGSTSNPDVMIVGPYRTGVASKFYPWGELAPIDRSGHSWPTPVTPAVVGVGFDARYFMLAPSLDTMGKVVSARLHRFTETTWDDNSSLTDQWWIANTFRDQNATGGMHETGLGPHTRFTMRKRHELRVTTGELPPASSDPATQPDDPDSVGIYVGANLRRGLTSAQWSSGSNVLVTITPAGSDPHGLAVGDRVDVTLSSPLLNDVNMVVTAVTATTFQYRRPGTTAQSYSGGPSGTYIKSSAPARTAMLYQGSAVGEKGKPVQVTIPNAKATGTGVTNNITLLTYGPQHPVAGQTPPGYAFPATAPGRIRSGALRPSSSGLRAFEVDGDGKGRWDYLIPVGTTIAYMGKITDSLGVVVPSLIPEGWLVCDGSEYPSSLYPDLFAKLGGSSSPYGYDSATGKFKVPDARDASIVGYSATKALGSRGGSATVSLTRWQQLPPHTHGAGTLTAGSAGSAHVHGVLRGDADGASANRSRAGNVTDPGNGETSSSGAHSHNVTGSTDSAGASEAFSVQNPYLAGVVLIKW